LAAHGDALPVTDGGLSKPAVDSAGMPCTVFRCSRQDQMFLYVREHFDHRTLPAPLVKRTGTLSPVMTLSLTESSVLARVSSSAVIRALLDRGWFLQLPPDGRPRVHLTFGG
jgi:uncharacterized protein YcgL (UPF0745 family)